MAGSDFYILPDSQFLGHTVRGQELGVTVLLQLREDGQALDNFRVHVHGDCAIQSLIHAADIVNIPEAQGVYLYYECQPGDAEPNINTTSTTFIDLGVGLRNDTFRTADSEGNITCATEFRAKVCGNGEDTPTVGASLRWATVVNDDNLIELHLQALPIAERFLKPGHREDNAATMHLVTVAVYTTMGNSDGYNGPYPVMFSTNPEAARQALMNNVGFAVSQFRKVANRFLHPEYLTFPEAMEYLRKFRAATGRPAFIPDPINDSGPSSKKPKTVIAPSGSASDAGDTSPNSEDRIVHKY